MFRHVVCINLDRRPQRWERFLEAIPSLGWYMNMVRYPAVDSRLAKPPPWFSDACPHPGAWGCLRTHLRIWEDALTQGWDNVLVFEDDAIFCDDFAAKFSEFMDAVPDDWDQIYLGGQHLYALDKNGDTRHGFSSPPQAVNEYVLRCQNVNRTHAYAMRPSMMQAASDTCALLPPGLPNSRSYHVDFRLGSLHSTHKVYAPTQWLVGQEHGKSDVLGGRKDRTRKWWNTDEKGVPFVIRPAETLEAVA